MDDRELLLRASEELPVQVSAASGAARDAAEEGRERGAGASSQPGCISWNGWGN